MLTQYTKAWPTQVIIIIKIFKGQNIVPRDYSKHARARAHTHTHTHIHTHTHTHTHTRSHIYTFTRMHVSAPQVFTGTCFHVKPFRSFRSSSQRALSISGFREKTKKEHPAARSLRNAAPTLWSRPPCTHTLECTKCCGFVVVVFLSAAADFRCC